MENKKYIFNNGLEDTVKEAELWEQGYNYPITAIYKLLGVSRSWVKQELLNHINYVVYAPKFVYRRSQNKTLTYIRFYDLREYIIKKADFLKQTEFVDLAYYLAPYKKVYKEAMDLYVQDKNRLNKLNKDHPLAKGYIPDRVLNYINDELNIIGAERNLSNQKRGRVAWKNIEPFDIFDNSCSYYTLKQTDIEGLNREMVYRNAFERGDTKIKLGSQITIFVKNNLDVDRYKMPFLIPYGQSIRVLGKKN